MLFQTEVNKNNNQPERTMNTDTPRTKEIWGAMLYTYPFLINCVTETGELERELTEARAEMPWYANGESKEEWMERQREKYQHLENTIKEVTEQRDDLLRYNEAFRKETLICADCDAIRKEEYDQAIEQRDRLAEALRKAISWGDSASHHILYRENINWTYLDEAREALQSLTPNETSAAAGGERKDHE
jgi:hypothetical protein